MGQQQLPQSMHLTVKFEGIESQIKSLETKLQRTQESVKEFQRSQSFQLQKSFETRLQTLEETNSQITKRMDATEACVYEFRTESFTNINHVENIFQKKNDVLRRAIADICRQMNLSSVLLAS